MNLRNIAMIATGALPIKIHAKMPWGHTYGRLHDPSGVLVSIACLFH